MNPGAITATAGKTYRHVKRRSVYRVLHIGNIQSDEWVNPRVSQSPGDPVPVDMEEVVVYVAIDDDVFVWVRPRREFEDGRFEEVPTLDPSPEPERSDYISDAQARELWGTEPEDDLPDGRVRVCAGEWVRIPGGYYLDTSAGLLHSETARAKP